MYELWARLRETHKDIRIGVIWYETMFQTEIDKLDKEKYESATIVRENDYLSPPVCYQEFKQYKPMVRKKVKR